MSLPGANLHSLAIILGCDGADGPLPTDVVLAIRPMPGPDTGNPSKIYCLMKIIYKKHGQTYFLISQYNGNIDAVLQNDLICKIVERDIGRRRLREVRTPA
jgi:hypothetical protein